jgi:hypothetical protein
VISVRMLCQNSKAFESDYSQTHSGSIRTSSTYTFTAPRWGDQRTLRCQKASRIVHIFGTNETKTFDNAESTDRKRKHSEIDPAPEIADVDEVAPSADDDDIQPHESGYHTSTPAVRSRLAEEHANTCIRISSSKSYCSMQSFKFKRAFKKWKGAKKRRMLGK